MFVRSCIDDYGGQVVKGRGDGFMVAFTRQEQAVRCGLDVQRALSDGARWMRQETIRVRIGIHVGGAVHRSGDVVGRNIQWRHAWRQAAGGEVLVS